ncbi:MAG TPA: hypothetical protein VL588_03535 [Bdellovibrionota bacterium]|jgi:hypothetical protein|nr:hypothetical protein [Bdellovibrionota bacterium]
MPYGKPRSRSHVTTDHDQIKRWAEERGARPVRVAGTGGEGDVGIIRLDFPGNSSPTLEHISWEQWFEKFDENDLALLYQETTSTGQKSNFSKLIHSESADEYYKKAA